jgi:mannosyl-oligosaccharide alpha-1,2-mannosidase
MAFVAKLRSSDGRNFHAVMDHLACFLPGALALGYLHGFPLSHLEMARNLTHTCYQLYHQSPSGLSPDEVAFNTHESSLTDFHPTAKRVV